MAIETSALTRIAEQRDRHLRQVAGIESDPRLSETRRRELLAAAHLGQRAKLAELHAQHEAELAEERARRERACWGMSSDPAAAADYRQALQAAGAVNTHEEMTARMRRALRVGDEVQAKALALVSSERGYRDAVQMYREASPAAAETLDSLREYDEELNNPASRLSTRMAFTVPMLPASLRGVNEQELQRLANAGSMAGPQT